MRIPLSVPVLEGNERAYLNECIDSGYVSSVGPFVTRFEEAFAERVGRRYAVACSSGTAALHVALQVSGVRPDDIVAVSDLTFIASANAIAYCGATPLLVDSEAKSWNLDSQQLFDYVAESARKGDPLPRAIEVVHLLGVPADMEPIRATTSTIRHTDHRGRCRSPRRDTSRWEPSRLGRRVRVFLLQWQQDHHLRRRRNDRLRR
jgi:dTDP-4-amino-4,6-dideoxygalactose transaminase